MIDNDYIEKLEQNRLVRIEGDIAMLKEASAKQGETIYGLSIGYERINTTIIRIIDGQAEHAKRLKEIEALSMISRHWKFILFTILTIIIVSLSIHASLKEVIGWAL